MAEARKSKGRENNAYTALLGLAVLALATAVGVVCYYGHNFCDSIFKISGY